MVSCARATRGLGRPSLDTRNGRPSSPPSREKIGCAQLRAIPGYHINYDMVGRGKEKFGDLAARYVFFPDLRRKVKQ